MKYSTARFATRCFGSATATTSGCSLESRRGLREQGNWTAFLILSYFSWAPGRVVHLQPVPKTCPSDGLGTWRIRHLPGGTQVCHKVIVRT
jgi:hypothetical protein